MKNINSDNAFTENSFIEKGILFFGYIIRNY